MSTIPSRRGQPWGDDEIALLLKEIKRNLPIEKIATLHSRTEAGIIGRLKQLAVEYYYGDGRPIEEIQKFTGLSYDIITEEISKWEPVQPKITLKKTITINDLYLLLKDIQEKVDMLMKERTHINQENEVPIGDLLQFDSTPPTVQVSNSMDFPF